MMDTDKLLSGLGSLVEKVKDVPVENIAATGLMVMGTVAVVGKVVVKQSVEVIKNVTNSK